MASLRFTDVQTRSTEFLDVTSLTGTIHISGQHENERRAGGEDTTELTTEPESSMML
jgi:hypothetical protein